VRDGTRGMGHAFFPLATQVRTTVRDGAVNAQPRANTQHILKTVYPDFHAWNANIFLDNTLENALYNETESLKKTQFGDGRSPWMII
jgi:hypothetical protein